MNRLFLVCLCIGAFYHPDCLFADEIEGPVLLIGMAECCEEVAYPEAEESFTRELLLAHVSISRMNGASVQPPSIEEGMMQAARDKGATAAVRITKLQGGGAAADIWVKPPFATLPKFMTIESDARPELPLPMITALRIVETLRAVFAAARIESEEPSTDTGLNAKVETKVTLIPKPAPTTAATLPRDKVYRLAFGLSGNIALSPGNAGTRGGFAIEMGAQPLSGLDVVLSCEGSPFGREQKTASVTSDMTYLLLTGWVQYRFFSAYLFQPFLGIGAGGFLGRAEGVPSASIDGASFNGEKATATSRVAYVGGAAGLFAFPKRMVGLYFKTTIGALMPEVQILHGTTNAARFGRPLMEIHLGLQIRLFAS